MKIIIIGVSGLIGHKLLQELSSGFDVYGILHRDKKYYGNIPLFSNDRIIDNVDVVDFEVLKGILQAVNADVIINCAGITKRKVHLNTQLKVINVNSVFPHNLSNWAAKNNKKIVHFSTDCVFDGKIGNYTEESNTNAEDIYGKTKALGEIYTKNSLTIRSSFIGLELFDKTELLEWFLAQNGKQIKGFTNTFYSGVSTKFMSKIVKEILLKYPNLNGLYQLAPEFAISKYELLSIAKKAFNINVEIVPDESQIHNPTLNASKLRETINLKVPSWREMLEELALERKFYTNL